VQAIRNLNIRAKQTVNAVLIEDKANGPAIVSVLKREIAGMISVNPQGGKLARASAVSPLIEAGNVYLPVPEEMPWIDDCLLEFTLFPSAKHDDRVDACSQALTWLQNRRALIDGAHIRACMSTNMNLRGSPWSSDPSTMYGHRSTGDDSVIDIDGKRISRAEAFSRYGV
jgi:predicted phage terminase large subunit-like protein